MGWSKLDDAVFGHAKFVMAGSDGVAMWLMAVAYASRYVTDGFVPGAVVPTLYNVRHPMKVAEHLVVVGLFERADGGYKVHDFLDYNPDRNQVEQRRAAEREKKAAQRAVGARAGARGSAGRYLSRRDNGRESPRDTPRESRRESPGESRASPVGCPPLPDPVNISLSSVSDLHRARPNPAKTTPPGGVGEEKIQVKPLIDRLVEQFMPRLLVVFGDSPRTRRSLETQVRRGLDAADKHVVDEAIGRCETADIKPRSVAYFATTLERTAAAYGITLVEMREESHG